MLSSCKRCLIVMPFSEQWLSIDWISSNVIIYVPFNAKVARINPGYNMHFLGGLPFKAVLRCMGGDLIAAVSSASRRPRTFGVLSVGR